LKGLFEKTENTFSMTRFEKEDTWKNRWSSVKMGEEGRLVFMAFQEKRETIRSCRLV